jgi:AcrR family transcriptional regulator
MVYRQTPRSERVRAASRARILDAAQKLFAQHGYDATTMQHIVAEAETSIGNAYFYFANKEGLLTTLVEDALRATWERADEVIASVEPGAARIAVAVYANVMHFLGSGRALARIAVTGVPSVVQHVVEFNWARLVALFTANFPGRSEKEILMSAAAVNGATRTAIELCLTGQLDIPPNELAKFMVTWHLRAFQLPEPEITRVLRIAARTVISSEGTRAVAPKKGTRLKRGSDTER